MRTNLLRGFAVAMGLSVCTIAQAQYSSNVGNYNSPSKWNNFNAPINGNRLVVQNDEKKAVKKALKDAATTKADATDELPAPAPEPMTIEPEAMIAPAADAAPCQSQCAPAVASRPALSPYFGSANLLFLTLENSGHRNLLVDDATGLSVLNSGVVDPSATTGFDIQVGRYFDCNRHGLSVGYMLWNPSTEQALRPSALGGYRAAMPQWNGIEVDPDGAGALGLDSIYNHFDNATAFRVRRDMRFQGIEANVSSFGIMGAGRAAYCGGNNGRLLGMLGRDCKGYGGAGGPFVPNRGGCIQVVTSHGFRWFQVDDDYEFAANINGVGDYQADDLYHNVDTKNNLYGYQFGSRLVYMLNNCWSLSVGGKFGLYGNHAELRQRIGSDTNIAYRTGVGTDLINTKDSDTVLSTLGELDLGLGYRFNNAWTVRGGYRLMGLTGIATATDHLNSEFSSVAASSYVNADDSILLHGGYVGLEFNW